MKKLIVLSAAFFSFNALAHIDCLVGDYTNAQGKKVFSVTEQHHSGILTNTQTGEQITLNVMKRKANFKPLETNALGYQICARCRMRR